MARRGGKKVGGIKPRAAPPAVRGSVAPRTVGGIRRRPDAVLTSAHVQSCPDNCPGEYVQDCWIHSKWCKWASVLWASHGKTEKDWQCPYGCPPLALPSGWTHPHDCKFWDATGRTPFDHADPFNPRSPR